MKNFIELEVKNEKISIAVDAIIIIQADKKGTIVFTSVKTYNLDKPYSEVMKLVQAAQG